MSAQARADGPGDPRGQRARRRSRTPSSTGSRRRSPEAQAVARAGAVIGRCFVPEVLAEIMDVPPDVLDDPIQELIDNGVLDPPGAARPYRLPPPAAARRHLSERAAPRPPPVPRAGRRVRHAARGPVGDPLVAPLRAGRRPPAGVRGGARRGPRRRRACRPTARRASSIAAPSPTCPHDHDPGEHAQRPDGAGPIEALDIEDLEIAERRGTRGGRCWRGRPAMPSPPSTAETLVLEVRSRLGLPASEEIAEIERAPRRARAAPGGGHACRARGSRDAPRGRPDPDPRPARARASSSTMVRKLGDELGDPEWADGRRLEGARWPTSSAATSAGLDRIGEIAHEAERRGYESTGVSAFRDASLLASRMMDYRAATYWMGQGLRYADSIEQSFCAHVMRADIGDGRLGDRDRLGRGERRSAARRSSIAAAGSGPRRLTGRSATSRCRAGRPRRPRWSSRRRSSSPSSSRASTCSCRRCGGSRRPPCSTATRSGPRRSAGMPSTGLALVGERVGLVPFVVTGVRAEQAAGRPARGRGLARRVRRVPRRTSPRSRTPPSPTAADWSPWPTARPASPGPPWRPRSAAGTPRNGSGRRPGHGSTSPSAWLARTASPTRSSLAVEARTVAARARLAAARRPRRRARAHGARPRLGRRAVAAAHGPRVRGRPAGRRGTDERRDRRFTRDRAEDGELAMSSTSWPSWGRRGEPRSPRGRATSTGARRTTEATRPSDPRSSPGRGRQHRPSPRGPVDHGRQSAVGSASRRSVVHVVGREDS